MKRKNPFERVKQYFVDDGGDICWWINEEDWESFQKEWSDEMPDIFQGESREINGKQYNEWLIGNTFGDYEGVYVDEDCSVCGHLLVFPHGGKGPERFCSNSDCNHENDEMKSWTISEFSKIGRGADTPELPRFRVEGESLEQFIERHKFSRLDQDGRTCVVCKNKVFVDDFFQTKDYAAIVFGGGHAENCANNGCPTVIVPLGENKKEWDELLFGKE